MYHPYIWPGEEIKCLLAIWYDMGVNRHDKGKTMKNVKKYGDFATLNSSMLCLCVSHTQHEVK